MIARTNLTCPDCGHQLDIRIIANSDGTVRLEAVELDQGAAA